MEKYENVIIRKEDITYGYVKVAGCDRSVGLTLVFCKSLKDPDSEGEECFCLNGPSSPHWKSYCDIYPLYEEKYEELFDLAVKQIEEGCVKPNDFYSILEESQSPFGNPYCAYKA